MKLTSLIQLGLVTSTTFVLGSLLSGCDSGGEALAPEQSGLGGSLGQGGTPATPIGFGGASSLTGGANNGTAGSASNAGSANGNGGSASGGSGNNGGSGNQQPPCTNLPPNNGDTCDHAVEYGWCSEDWLGDSCREACGKCSNGNAGTGSGGSGSQGGSGNNTSGSGSVGGFGGGGGQPPVIENGQQGFSTRYWDCCKPHCAWTGNAPGGDAIASCNKQDQSVGVSGADNACQNQNSGVYMCHDFSPWAVSDKLAYGFAAYKGVNDVCGRCYQLQFTGSSHSGSNDPGSQSLSGKTMIVQAINIGGIENNQFDLLIPGGGVGEFNACSSQWGTSDLGEQYGGFYLACQKQNGYKHAESRACAAQKCQSVFAGRPELLAGCNFFINWFNAADNPNLVYKEVTCPAAITAVSGMSR